jgi:nucleotide-binding universal stress UspA family protein
VVICRRTEGRAGRGAVVAVDTVPESCPGIEFAFAQAALRHLPLTAVHSLWDAVIATGGSSVDTQAELSGVADFRRELAETVARLGENYPGVTATQRVAYGLVDDVVVERHTTWDLVVLGRHLLDSSEHGMTGSIANTIIERSRTTVAVVPEPGAERPR